MRIHEFDGEGARWRRSVLENDEGEMFVPAGGIGMGDTEAMLCCSYDGTPIVYHNDHCFVPARWAVREFSVSRPDDAEAIRSICKRVEDARAQDADPQD